MNQLQTTALKAVHTVADSIYSVGRSVGVFSGGQVIFNHNLRKPDTEFTKSHLATIAEKQQNLEEQENFKKTLFNLRAEGLTDLEKNVVIELDKETEELRGDKGKFSTQEDIAESYHRVQDAFDQVELYNRLNQLREQYEDTDPETLEYEILKAKASFGDDDDVERFAEYLVKRPLYRTGNYTSEAEKNRIALYPFQ